MGPRALKKGSLSTVDYIVFPAFLAITLYNAVKVFGGGPGSRSEGGGAAEGTPSRFLLDDLKAAVKPRGS
jgi:hypothetical protein